MNGVYSFQCTVSQLYLAGATTGWRSRQSHIPRLVTGNEFYHIIQTDSLKIQPCTGLIGSRLIVGVRVFHISTDVSFALFNHRVLLSIYTYRLMYVYVLATFPLKQISTQNVCEQTRWSIKSVEVF